VITLRRDVKEGKSLAEAMESRPDVFSRMYINIVRAGEEGGILHQLLPDLVDFLETSGRNRSAILSAMIYPVVLLVTGIISVFLLLAFVVPQFAIMFEDAGTEIPASAAFLLALSEGIQRYGYLVILFFVGVWFWWKWLDADPQRKLQKHAFLLRVPMLGALLLSLLRRRLWSPGRWRRLWSPGPLPSRRRRLSSLTQLSSALRQLSSPGPPSSGSGRPSHRSGSAAGSPVRSPARLRR